MYVSRYAMYERLYDNMRAHRELRSNLFLIQNPSGVSPALDEKRVTFFE